MVLLQRGLKKKKKNEYLFFNFKTIYMKYESIIEIEIKKMTNLMRNKIIYLL
jgi:hypothetical protein